MSEIAKTIKKSEVLPGLTLYTAKTKFKGGMTLRGSVLGGSRFAPSSNIMTTRFVKAMLDESTRKKGKKAINKLLASRGTGIGFGLSSNRISFNSKFLKEDSELVIKILSMYLREPLFRKDEVELVRKRIVANIEAGLENTGKQADKLLGQQLFSKNHINYPVDNKEAIKLIEKITVGDLKKYHKKNLGLGDMFVVVVGDVDHDELERLLYKYFKTWQTLKLKPRAELQKKSKQANKKPLVKTMKDKTSASVYLGGLLSVEPNSRERVALGIGIDVLGGGFMARLVQHVRDKEGLTYHIRSSVRDISYGDTGTWCIYADFAPEIVVRGIKETEKVLKGLLKKGITDKELRVFKERAIGADRVALATTGGLSGDIISLLGTGKDPSYIDEWVDIVRSIKKDEVNKALRRHLDLKSMIITVAGSVDNKLRPLK